MQNNGEYMELNIEKLNGFIDKLNLNHMKEDMNIMAILISAFLMFIGV